MKELTPQQKQIIKDLTFLLGLVLLSLGLYHVYKPLSLIVPGCILILVALFEGK